MSDEIEILDCEQGSDDWFRARMGMPTASQFATVMATGKGGGESKTRRKYLLRLAGEVITQKPAQTFVNEHMERGTEMEPEARAQYAFEHGVELTRIGFARNVAKNYGASPDSLIGEDGMLEIKTALPDLLIEMHLAGRAPPEHMAQCQGGMLVLRRKWVDLRVYWPAIPPFTERIYRNDQYCAQLEAELKHFNVELRDIVRRINAL